MILVEVEGGVVGLFGAEAAKSGRGAFHFRDRDWRIILAVCAGEQVTARAWIAEVAEKGRAEVAEKSV